MSVFKSHSLIHQIQTAYYVQAADWGYSYFYFNFFSIEVELIYNVVLVSGVQHSDSDIYIHIHMFFFRLFSLLGYYKILNTEYISLCYTVGPCCIFSFFCIFSLLRYY